MRLLRSICASLLFACGGQARDAHDPVSVAIGTARAAAPAVAAPKSAHAKILDRLANAKSDTKSRNGVAVPLPDPDGWADVDFWLVPSVLSVQYGDASDFHAILGAFLVNVANADAGACDRAFLPYARHWLDAFDSEAVHEKEWAGWWMRTVWTRSGQPVREERVAIQGAYIFGRVMTLLAHGTYSSAYVVYPAWESACLAIGVAVPNRDDAAQEARALRDRFLNELLPNVRVSVSTPPEEERH